jgi:putative transposase
MTIGSSCYRRGRHVVSALHVHLAFVTKYRRGVEVSVSALVNSLKGVSARRRSQYTARVNQARMNGHSWSPSYFAASRGGAPLSIIRQYTEQQQRPA